MEWPVIVLLHGLLLPIHALAVPLPWSGFQILLVAAYSKEGARIIDRASRPKD